MYILANMWFTKLIKQFFFWIDKIVYNFISSIYDLLITIARTSVLTQADIADMANRIYKLLAIFMIFKVTLSLITYVVNPDDFSDKSKGVAKLGTNIVISLAMLVLTPYIFNYAYQFQTMILEDNSLATLIFGGSECKNETSFFNSAGDDMAFITMGAFLSPNLSLDDLHECSVLMETTPSDDSCGEDTVKFNAACKTALTEQTKDNPNFDTNTMLNYIGGIENNSLGLLFRQELITATNKGNTDFIMDYKFIFSTVVGVVIILLLITFCMDVAVRSLKLAFLQLIAPIPILSYVDPKSGKDGLFKKWYEMCLKTYVSLFVRLLALYFAVYIISKVADMKLVDIVDGSYQTGFLLSVFVIIGALMFAKQLPKILEGLGIKLDGDGKFTLNPLRKMEKEALGGGILKKPNDMLAKAGKGILKSPFSAASLVGRKAMAGIDSKAHGKGFWNGTKNVKSKMAQAKDKFMEKNLPYSYKAGKDKKEGRDEIALMRSNWKAGSKAIDRLQNAGYTLDHLDGDSNNSEAYTKAGFSGRFKESKMNLDYATERKKLLQRVYNARQIGKSAESIIAEESENMRKYGVSESTIKSETQLSQALDNQTKQVSGLEKVHESYRKQYAEQASLEDQIKFVKYNNPDPTTGDSMEIVKRSSSSSSSSGSSSSSSGSGSSSSSSGSGSSSSSSSSGSSSSSSGSGSSSSSSSSGSSSSSSSSGSSSSSSSSGSSSSSSSGEVHIPEGPSATAEREQQENNDREKEQRREEIRKLKSSLDEEEKKMKNTIEEIEETIIKIENRIYNTSDEAEKEKLKKEKEEKEMQIERYKKQIEEYRKNTNDRISFLESLLN